MLPGITTYEGGGSWARVSDPSVAHDAKHGTWMVTGLVIDTNVNGAGVTVSRSPNGTSWQKPVMAVGDDGQGYDKEWIVCDNSTSSPHYGSCYIEADITSSGNKVVMSTSTDGGATWSTARTVAGPMSLTQIANTTQGSMVGDYLSTSVIGGKAVSTFAVGKPSTDSQAFNEALYTAGGLPVTGGPVKTQQAAHNSAPNPGTGAGRVPLRTVR
ncbi:sialidase family protein [Streptomyces sp. cg2]|uniref:sialidase family protein n=1 Tax=Streptomyces sp. cg2 TaxID=3238799 RepID=UPI0034E2F761